ncbi:MAG: DNA repair protein RecN [Anaplasmataceae bacterium]|nr:DNA repair protein RecN [Anaplasmataceae bacterium]
MLKRLDIENLLLVKKAQVLLDAGFTVITGETGSGKTIFLQALKYVTGERAGGEIVRNGAVKAVIEAEFDLTHPHPIQAHLEGSGIPWEPEEPLLLKREISREGRSRAFINCQMVTLSFLQTIGKLLIDFTDQHAHYEIKKTNKQRLLIDLFGGLSPLVQEATLARDALKAIENQLSTLKQSTELNAKELEKIQGILSEISAANIRDREEEEITLEHHRLAHARELTDKTDSLLHLLETPPYAMIAQNRKLQLLIQQIATIDPTLQDIVTISQEVGVGLQELHNSLTSYLSKIDANPKRLEYLEARLATIDKIKKKYGDVVSYFEELKQKEIQLSSHEEEIEKLTVAHQEAETIAMNAAKRRFASRKQSALNLSKDISAYLQRLNMELSVFSIEVSFSFAEDDILFFLQANPGQPGGPIQEFASGGELSRLMISLQVALANNYPTPTIIFDEIDANIGGETATIVGELFHELARHRQVLAITHFSQVAKKADHHIRIGKQKKETDTFTTVESLREEERSVELLRMLGGRQAVPPTSNI